MKVITALSCTALCLLAMACSLTATTAPAAEGPHDFLGTSCNMIDSTGCNLWQIFSATHSGMGPYTPSLQLLDIDQTTIQEEDVSLFSDAATSIVAETIDVVTSSSATSFGVGGTAGVFSASVTYDSLVQTMYGTTERQYLASAVIAKTVKTISIKPNVDSRNLHPNSELKAAFLALPKQCTAQSLAQFGQFFQQYGTHYVSQVDLGGRVIMNVKIAESTAETHNLSQDSIGASVSYMLEAKIGSKHTTTNAEDLSTFDKVTVSELVVLGGEETSLEDNVYKWAESVSKLPTVITTQVKPISNVFKAVDSTRAAALDLAFSKLVSLCAGQDGSICSGVGSCQLLTGKCKCPSTRYGDQCEYHDCPTTCGDGESCDTSTGNCCQTGYYGEDCSLMCGTHTWTDPTTSDDDPHSSNEYFWVSTSQTEQESCTCACNYLSPGSSCSQYTMDYTYLYYPYSVCEDRTCHDSSCYYFDWIQCNMPTQCPYSY